MANSVSSKYGHFDDLVFESRNTSYGAYQIRKSYSTNGIIGFGAAVFLVLALIFGPMIYNWIQSMKPKEKEIVQEKLVEVTLTNPESLDEEEKEVIKEVKQEAPKMESVKFTIPVVTTEEVTEVTTTEELNASNPGSVTQDGEEGFTGMPDGEGGDEVVGNTGTQEEIFTVVEQMPQFPGGDAALTDFLDKNLQYPQMAKEQGIQGKVWVQFIVDKFGNVSNVETLRGIGGGCDEEAKRVVSMMPRWNPGKQSGRAVPVKFRFPINFTLR